MTGCSDWLDRNEPVAWRSYQRGGMAPADVMAFYATTWEAAGYQRVPGDAPDRAAWTREHDGWTAALSVHVSDDLVQVTGRDTTSRACR